MLEDLAAQGVDKALAGAPMTPKPKGTEVVKAAQAAMRSGFALGVSGAPPGDVRPVLALRNGGRAPLRDLVGSLAPKAEPADRRGRKVATVGGVSLVSSRGDDLLVVDEKQVDATLDLVEGKGKSARRPAAPGRAAARRRTASNRT